MADPDFKNIKFAYVRVVNGYPSIDGSMTDRIFYSTNPDGYYRCFIFPKEYFSGVDHEDLRNLVSIEKSNIWDETLRTTFLGYNAVSNEFILNLNAYYGLKVYGLKTDGNLKYSGQASWQVMKLTTTQESDSIVTLKQTNGTNVYLSIKPVKVTSSKRIVEIYPSLSVELDKKSIKDAPLLVKDNMLWAKSPEDGTPIMVNNYVKTTNFYNHIVGLSDDGKLYGFIEEIGGEYYKFFLKSMRFGKELVYFDSTETTEKAPLYSFRYSVYIPNNTGVVSVEYTDTSSLSDILASGESLTFKIISKDKYIWGYTDGYSFNYPNIIEYNILPAFSSLNYTFSRDNFILKEYVDENVVGYEYNLISCDTRKPFLFNSSDRISGIAKFEYIDNSTIFKNLPDGYIALMLGSSTYDLKNQFIMRWKKGDPVKVKGITSANPFYVSVEGTTKFGTTIYGEVFPVASTPTPLNSETIQLNDVINSTGFVDITDKFVYSTTYSLITIVRL